MSIMNTGWHECTTVVDAGGASTYGPSWSNIDYSKVLDSNFAETGYPTIFGLVTPHTSSIIKATNFGFNIPNGSVIKGIEVGIFENFSATMYDIFGNESYSPQNHILKLVKNNVDVGINSASDENYLRNDWYIKGNETSLWGTSWTTSDINSTNFGVITQVSNIYYYWAPGPFEVNDFAKIDSIRIRIYYDIPDLFYVF